MDEWTESNTNTFYILQILNNHLNISFHFKNKPSFIMFTGMVYFNQRSIDGRRLQLIYSEKQLFLFQTLSQLQSLNIIYENTRLCEISICNTVQQSVVLVGLLYFQLTNKFQHWQKYSFILSVIFQIRKAYNRVIHRLYRDRKISKSKVVNRKI